MIAAPRWLVWAAQPAVIVVAIWLALGGPLRNVRTPLVFSGDGLATLAQAKLTIDQGRWWTVPDTGATQPDDPLLSWQRMHVDQVWVRIAHVFTRRAAPVVTLAWALMLVAAGLSSAWCLRRLGVSDIGAWSAGVLFAFFPVALERNTAAFGYAPYLVPFAATAALQLALGRASTGWRGWGILLAGCVALGFNTPYLAVFGAFFVGIGAFAGFVWTRRRAEVTRGGVILAGVLIALMLNLSPGPGGPAPDQPPDTRRVFFESEFRALKIRQLVAPLPGHWFGPFRDYTDREARARFPADPVSRSQLGLIASLGFLGLLAVLFMPSVAGAGEAGDTMRAASRLTFAAILLATVGGLGNVFSLMVVPSIRDYTFITPFIAFFSLAAIALALDRATGARRAWRAAVWAALLAIGLFDQSVSLGPVNDRRESVSEKYDPIRDFMGVLEGTLPPGAAVFQLPLPPSLPEDGIVRMGSYDRFKPVVVSRTLRWSTPATDVEAMRLLTEAAARDPRALPIYLRRQGFAAILVDRLGYADDGLAILEALQVVPGAARPVAQDTRYVALDIRRP